MKLTSAVIVLYEDADFLLVIPVNLVLLFMGSTAVRADIKSEAILHSATRVVAPIVHRERPVINTLPNCCGMVCFSGQWYCPRCCSDDR